jgi:hypothetical protein
MPALRKPLAEITPDDVRALIAEGWAEDELLEFKESLSGKGAAPDKWMVDQSEVGTAAKRAILKEIVGMANSYGGDILLGMRESDAQPHRAEEIITIPKCEDLASRIAMFARDHVRPEVPLLAVRGVATDADSGVVVIRVPSSALAPHRLEIKGMEKECYKRVRDRTEAMSMREIQELTLERERGVARLNHRLDELRARHEEFCQLRQVMAESKSALTFTVRAVPLVLQSYVPRVHGIRELTPEHSNPRVTFSNNMAFQCTDPHHMGQWRPMLRGTRSVADSVHLRNLIELSTDGAYLRSFMYPTQDEPDGEKVFAIGWVLAAVITACDTVDRFRKFAGIHSVEFALEIEIRSLSAPHRVLRLGSTGFDFGSNEHLTGQLVLPRYSLGPVSQRPELLSLIYDDIWASFGIDTNDDRIVAVTL